MNIRELAKKYNISYANLYYHVKKYNIENEKQIKEHFEKKKETKELCFFRVEKDIKNKIENYSSNNFSKNVRDLILIGLEKTSENKK